MKITTIEEANVLVGRMFKNVNRYRKITAVNSHSWDNGKFLYFIEFEERDTYEVPVSHFITWLESATEVGGKDGV